MTDFNANSIDTEEQIQLKKALKSAQTAQETLKAFKEMESCFNESQLGPTCFLVAKKLFTFGHRDITQVVSFAKRAVSILTLNKAPSLHIALIFKWLGNLCLRIHEYDDCLRYFNLASDTLVSQVYDSDSKVLDLLLDVENKLCSVTKKLHMNEDVVVHTERLLEIKEKMLEGGCLELGHANKEVYEACLIAVDIEGALPYCKKALEIYKKHYGVESMEVGKVTMHVGLIYLKMGKLDKAFEMNQIAVRVLKKVAPNSVDMMAAEADCCNILIDLGRFKEASVILKRLVTFSDVTKEEKLNLLMSLAKALCSLEKFAEAKKHLKAVQKMLEKKEVHPKVVAIICCDMSIHYEQMKDFAAAASLIKRALELPKFPLTMITSYSTKFFKLMCLSGKEKEGLLYMEGFVGKLKNSYGSQHDVVGHVYAQLGAAYSKSGLKELAAKALRNAKDVLDVTNGPHDLTSLKTSHDLSVALADLKRYAHAMVIEVQVAKGVEGLPPSELGFVHEVSTHLSKMKQRVAESSTAASS